MKDKIRSTRIEHWASLFAIPGTTWHSTVIQEDAEPLPDLPNVLSYKGKLPDWEATAQLLERCDLTISVDTAVAHLAGHLGKPYWGLIPQPPEWRWGSTGYSTAWYPLATLYRQPIPGAWEPVFQRLETDLRALMHA